MKTETFDDLTRIYGNLIASRRIALKSLGGGALAAALGALGLNRATAACGLVGDRCERGNDCCAGGRCAGGRCRCQRGLTECDGRCRDLDTSRTNCRVCGNTCSGLDGECRAGNCCRTNFTTCTDVCGVGFPCSVCCSGFCHGDGGC